MPAMASLFQELILEHYKKPRNRGELEGADVDVHMNNPTCGDAAAHWQDAGCGA